MTNDGLNALVYDAENRTLSSTNGSASGIYTYDGENLRVKKVSGSTTNHTAVRHVVADGKVLTSFGPLGPSGHLMEQVLAINAAKTVVVALGSLYLIVNYPEIKTYICTYAQPTTSEISAVKAIFGEIQNRAKLPVALPGIAPRGFSLPWPPSGVASITMKSSAMQKTM